MQPPPAPLLQHDGRLVRVAADARSSGGAYALLDIRAPRGVGMPCHVHEHEDEHLHVLDGRLDVALDGDHFELGAQEALHLPRGLPHQIVAASAEARYLVLCVPAGVEDFLRTTGEAVVAGDATGFGARLDFEDDDVAALLAAAGLRLLPHLGRRLAPVASALRLR